MAPIIPHGGHAQLNFLPFIVGTHFRNGCVKFGLNLVDHAPDNFPFPLERSVVIKEKLDL